MIMSQTHLMLSECLARVYQKHRGLLDDMVRLISLCSPCLMWNYATIGSSNLKDIKLTWNLKWQEECQAN